jgi:predicted nucleic acid-binding protein
MICVDASVAAKWILAEEHADRSLALYLAAVEADEPIVAPPLLPVEVINILRQRVRSPKGPSIEEARLLLDRFLAFALTLLAPPGLHLRALDIADSYGLRAVYDAHYLALCELLGCEVWTDDRRLLRDIGTRLPYVRWIGDYPMGT